MREYKKQLLAAAILCAAVYGAYLNTLPNPFIFDDRHMIAQNNYIKNPRLIPLLFTDKITSVPIARGMWRPLLMLSLAFNYFFSGLNPYGYHLVNILLHFLNAVLLYLLLGIFFKRLNSGTRLGIALIFCLHPVNTETVTYISCRSTLLASFFILFSFYNYLRWRQDKKTFRCIISLLSYVLALMSKEIGIILPGLITAYEFVRLNETAPAKAGGFSERMYKPFKQCKRAALRILPFALISIGYLILIKYIFGDVFGIFAKTKLPAVRPFSENILTQAAISFFYIYLFFFPFYLCVDHPIPAFKPAGFPFSFTPLFIIALLTIAAVKAREKFPLIAFCVFWYFICLIPQFYGRLNIMAAEHHAYLAYFSVYFFIAHLLENKKIRPVYLRLGLFFILGLFLLLTLIRNLEWRSEYTLWVSELRSNPDSDLAHGSLGIDLINRGFLKEGESHLLISMKSNKDIIRKTSLLNLAGYYALFQNQPDKALRILNENKEYLWANDAPGYLKTLSSVYVQMGKTEEAREILETALKIHRQTPDVKTNLGWLYLQYFPDGHKKAGGYFEEELRENPDNYRAHMGLAEVLLKENRVLQAVSEYRKAIRANPKNPEPYYKLGVIYTQKLFDQKAEAYFLKAIELSPGFSQAYYNLCVFYLSLPDPNYQKAQEYLNKAKELNFKPHALIEQIILNKTPPENIPYQTVLGQEFALDPGE